MVGGIPLAWNLAGSMIGYYGYTEEYEVGEKLHALSNFSESMHRAGHPVPDIYLLIGNL